MAEIPDKLIRALRKAPLVAEHEIDVYVQAARSGELTATELMALRCHSHGLHMGETAEAMGRPLETIKTCLKTARYKLRAKTTTHACCEAIRQGLIP